MNQGALAEDKHWGSHASQKDQALADGFDDAPRDIHGKSVLYTASLVTKGG